MADNECCTRAENLVQEPDDRPNVIVRRCKWCGRRHIEMVAEPGIIGVRGGGM
jgi:hypothetical protein